jgi:hypothetical protein
MERLASREYHLEVTLDGYAPLHRTLQLGVTEDLDLGILQLSKGGQVQVQVDGPLSDSNALCHVIDGAGRTLQTFALQGGAGVSPQLPEGAVTLRFTPTNGATQFAEVEVTSGETSSVRFMTRPGTGLTIPVRRKNGQPIRFRTRARITDTLGNVHFATEDLRRVDSGTIGLTGLEAGRYRLWVQDPGGPVQESWLDVGAVQGPAAVVQLDW